MTTGHLTREGEAPLLRDNHLAPLLGGLLASAVCVTGCSSSARGGEEGGGNVRSDAGAEEGSAETSVATDAVADAGPTIGYVALPGGDGGIGFDDLRFAPTLRQVLAPAGRTGNLDLVDPTSLTVTTIGGFSASAGFMAGAHSSGCTSADEAPGAILAIDHETQSLKVVDPSSRTVVSSTPLAGGPDYVRWVAPTGEAWVTEPFTGMEVLKVPSGSAPAHAATIAVMGGPEAIAVDASHGRVYTNSFSGQTFALDVAKRAVVETWTNGCSGLSLGVAVDEARMFVFVACQAGSVMVLDAAHAGAMLGTTQLDSAVDIIDYAPALHHLYAPTKGGSLAIVGVPSTGVPALLGTVAVPQNVQGVTTDGRAVWVGDPAGGQVLRVEDPFAATP